MQSFGMSQQIKQSHSIETQRVLTLLEGYADLLHFKGHSVQPYSQTSVLKLLSFNEKQRRQFDTRLQRFNTLMSGSVDVEVAHKDDRYFIELCAKRMGLIFDKGVYDMLKTGDVVEIYNVDLIQVFRNFAFFDVCSYTLLDLINYEFFELYDRSQLINHYILEATATISKRGYDLSPLSLQHVPKHLLQEKFSQDKLTSMVQFKWMYPVYTWPQVHFGYLVVQSGEVLSEVPPEQHLSFI
jgi:hypothetical protein